MAVRLFVGNMPYGATEADLRTHFGAVGDPSQVVIPVDRNTGRPRGFAFVEYQDKALAEQAIAKFNQQPFMGRTLSVSEAYDEADDRYTLTLAQFVETGAAYQTVSVATD